MTALERKVLALSVATGCTVAIGTRGESKGWFANVDGIETESGSLNTAVDALIQEVLRTHQREIKEIEARQRQHQAAIALLNP